MCLIALEVLKTAEFQMFVRMLMLYVMVTSVKARELRDAAREVAAGLIP
jgi:hypothetical protein